MSPAELIATASPTNFWIASCLAIAAALLCCFWSFRSLRHTRIIEDTPTARVRSAAQGYTELEGVAELLDGEPIISPLTGTRCVWYRVKVEERNRNSSGPGWLRFAAREGLSSFFDWPGESDGWSLVYSELSDSIFRFRDATGTCIVDPEGADVKPKTTLIWYGDSSRPRRSPAVTASRWQHWFSSAQYRYTEQRIYDGDPVYLIGMFLTLGAHQPDTDMDAEIRDLLASWKRDKNSLLQRFDLNRDGRIDAPEWEVVRKVAAKTVHNSRDAATRTEELTTNVLRKPQNTALPFIVSAVPQPQLIARNRTKAVAFNLAFIVSVAVTAWAFHTRFW